MTQLISDSDKATLQLVMKDLHDTFARDVVIWKTAKQTIISTNPEHNMFFESAPINDNVQNVPVSGTFKARILYGVKQSRKQFFVREGHGEDQINAELEVGQVRIKLEADGANFIKDAVRVTLDGEIFNVDTSSRPHGLFTPNLPGFFYTFYLTKLN